MINTGSSTEHSVHRTSCPSANRPSEGCGRFSSSIFSKHDSLPATTQGAVKICRLPSAEGQGLRARWRTWAARRRMASVTVSSGPALPAGTPMDASSRSGRAAPGRPPLALPPAAPPSAPVFWRSFGDLRPGPARPWGPFSRRAESRFRAPGVGPPSCPGAAARRSPIPGLPGAPTPAMRPSESASALRRLGRGRERGGACGASPGVGPRCEVGCDGHRPEGAGPWEEGGAGRKGRDPAGLA